MVWMVMSSAKTMMKGKISNRMDELTAGRRASSRIRAELRTPCKQYFKEAVQQHLGVCLCLGFVVKRQLEGDVDGVELDLLVQHLDLEV